MAYRISQRYIRLLVAATILLLTTGHSPPAATRSPADGSFLRGMTVSCPGYGQIWGSPAMAQSLSELSSLGVGWVAIHPYAGVRRDGGVRMQAAADTGYLERAAGLARREGIELFWKPHLAYWGSFDWRGDISFDDEASWRRFFDGYRAFIVDQARFAERWRVPLFAVGLEYEKTTHREEEWRRIIAEVRRVYSGKITYSANWDGLDRVPFWDAVDLIGVQAYFPLSQEPYPTVAAIRRGWDAPLEALRELSQRHGKPVLFAEIGYDVSAGAASEPWRGERRTGSRSSPSGGTTENRALQRRLMEVALERLEREPHVAGMFWWKWMPGSRHRGDFSMRHPGVMDVVRRAWQDVPRISAE